MKSLSLFKNLVRWAAVGLVALGENCAFGQQKEVTIAYPQIDEPWVVGIANGSIMLSQHHLWRREGGAGLAGGDPCLV